jgi:hypothetical protein
MFKVVPDQLTVSDGWVRCGHCDGVFDASAHFQPTAESETLVMPETKVQEPHLSEPELIDEDDPTDFFPPLAATSFRPVVDDVPPNVLHELTNDSDRQIQYTGLSTQPEALGAPSTPRFSANAHLDDASVSAPLSSYLSAPEAADFSFQDDHGRSQDAADRRILYGSTVSSKPINSVRIENAQRPALAEVTFVQTAKRREKSKGPFYRVLAVLITLLLLGTLALQVLLHERDALAARYPALLPALDVLCEPFDCQINPPRTIQAITIDSSSFTQTGADAYRLDVVIKNTRSAVVAMPALEVTLTGSKNEVLMRKVLLPSEFGATSHRLERAIPFAVGLTLLVSPPALPVQPLQAVSSVEGVSVPITGYRLFAFYP